MQETKDGFKWFGEGFDGFPRSVPEDCVEYTIHLVDSKLNDSEKRQELRKIHSAGIKLINELTKGFMWQREGISLALEREDGRSLLRGRTNYGDSIENEWLVVYILRELSKKFANIWIRVVDTDGQFLLIEAAGVIPRWLNPEIADFRVWLNTGRLLIIPLLQSDAKVNQTEAKPEPRSPSLEEALEFLENHGEDMIDSSKIQAEAFHRLGAYPARIMDSLHHALIKVPRKLAYILHEDPAYICPAVEAFYLRDPIALRPLQSHEPSRLIFPPEDCVRTSAKFTKVGYAQLKSQQFEPPKLWAEAFRVKYEPKVEVETELGMKIASGFETLITDPQRQDQKAVREIKLLLEDLEAGEGLLPSDRDINEWGSREDDETWLDVNFEDFEKELGGKSTQASSDQHGGFGDKGAQDNLRKTVERFEEFLNDDVAGAEGAEFLDGMDEDDDEEEDSSSDDSASEDKDISFDEDEFANMMREMLGMPIDELATTTPKTLLKATVLNDERVDSVASDDEDHREIHQGMLAIEQELREAGALDVSQKQNFGELKPQAKAVDMTRSGRDRSYKSNPLESTGGEGDVNIDLNLAKNLLESLKSQGGVSGPGSNLMGLMGLQMPRHEYEKD